MARHTTSSEERNTEAGIRKKESNSATMPSDSKIPSVFHFLLEVWNHVEHAVARAELKIAGWAAGWNGL